MIHEMSIMFCLLVKRSTKPNLKWHNCTIWTSAISFPFLLQSKNRRTCQHPVGCMSWNICRCQTLRKISTIQAKMLSPAGGMFGKGFGLLLLSLMFKQATCFVVGWILFQLHWMLKKKKTKTKIQAKMLVHIVYFIKYCIIRKIPYTRL